MKKTIAILLVAILAVSSVFAAFSGEASLGFGGNLDNGNFGFIDSASKVTIDADLATATAEQIAEGDVYASIKATFGLKLTTGEEKRAEVEDPSQFALPGYVGGDYKVGIIADITEAKVAGANWEVSILGLDDAPNYAKGFQTYTVEDGYDKWGLSRADFDENYNNSVPFEKATGVQATVYGFKVGFGLLGDYSDEKTWELKDYLNIAALFETPEFNFGGVIVQAGTAYSYESFEKLEKGKPVSTGTWTETNAWDVSAKVGYASEVFSLTAATDVAFKFAEGKDTEVDADVALNFNYDFLTVDAYYGTNPVTGKTPATADELDWVYDSIENKWSVEKVGTYYVPDTYFKERSEDMLSAQVKVDLNSFNVPVALTVGVNDILATQELVAKAEITAIEGLKLTVNGGYTIDADGRVAAPDTVTGDYSRDIVDDKDRDYVGKWKAGLDAEYDMNIMKITAGISAEQRIQKGADVKLGLNAAVETSSLIPGATLKLAWADAEDILKSENDNTKELGKITASIKMTF